MATTTATFTPIVHQNDKGFVIDLGENDGEAVTYTCDAVYKSGKKKGQSCGSIARWVHKDQHLCGRHCTKRCTERVSILYTREIVQKSEKAAKRKQELTAHKVTIGLAQMANVSANRRGVVRCNKEVHYRDKTVKNKCQPLVDGYLNVGVCSNNRTWKGLSPMILGPVHCGEQCPDRTIITFATNVENYWQAAKVYTSEVENPKCDDISQYVIKSEYWETRKTLYSQDKAVRRKQFGTTNANTNVALFSVFGGKRYEYVEARRFYCREYERLARASPEYMKLNQVMDEGTNIQVIGYDGHDAHVTYPNGEGGIDWHFAYLDASRPFGHEMVVTWMLENEGTDAIAPWNV